MENYIQKFNEYYDRRREDELSAIRDEKRKMRNQKARRDEMILSLFITVLYVVSILIFVK